MSKKIKRKASIFWKNENGKLSILHSNLIYFLEKRGFLRVKLDDTNYLLVKESNRMISKTSESEAIGIIKNYLIRMNLKHVYELFAKGVGSYISGKKLDLLKSVKLVDDRDNRSSSNFYFRNCYCNVNSKEIILKEYDTLSNVIWKNRIINRRFEVPKKKEGQFEILCKNICNNSIERFDSLKTILGYLLHRNKDRGETVAIILYDENMGINNQAHGGTCKTLLSQAIAQCREVESINGKEVKTGSWFKNQRINITTDVLVYDDLNKDLSLENFYSTITTGIEVEKKRQQAFFIDFKKSPKVLITSNYIVKGSGGSSDRRRRFEFELHNHYNDKFTPEDEFGNRFFDDLWSKDEWNKFFMFMMECVQSYLEKGLIKTNPINLSKARVESGSCEEFYNYASMFIVYNEWHDKREFLLIFKDFYPEIIVSPHRFTKWLNNYAIEVGGELETRNSGGVYSFRIKKVKVNEER